MAGELATIQVMKKGSDVAFCTISGVTDINKGMVDGTIALSKGDDETILLVIADDEILIFKTEGK